MVVAIVLFWLTIFSVAVAYCNARLDSVLYITYRKKITHWTRGFVRVVLMSLGSWLPSKWIGFDWLQFAFFLGYSGATFWIVFERLYNKWIGQKPDFVGTTAGTDKTERKLFGVDAGKWVTVIKVVLWVVLLNLSIIFSI